MTAPEREAGSATTELVILMPLLVIMLLFVVALGRVASARADVDAAARDAARAASITRNRGEAIRAGENAARATLHEGSITCRDLTVAVATEDFRPDGTVTATVACTVDLAQVSGFGLPGTCTIRAAHTAPVDHYRGVS
jgi:Flp pilus assembly protein TadG